MIDQQQPPQAPIPTTAQEPQMQVALQLTPQGLVVTVVPTLGVLVQEDMMAQIVKEWLATHEALLQEIVRETAAKKRAELEIIRHVRNSKL